MNDVSFLMSSFHVFQKAAIKRLDTMHNLNTDFRSKDERDFDEWLTMKHSTFLEPVLPRKIH